MPSRDIELTDYFDQFVRDLVKSGRYESISDVVCTALRLMERDQQKHEEKLAALRAAID